MNKFKPIIALTLGCLLLASCMDGDHEQATDTTTMEKMGNPSIAESNVLTIAQLKEKYNSAIRTSYALEEVTEDIQIKGFVTGNDITGNIYQEVALEDATGAIIVSIEEGGLNGYLPLGAEVLINLKGLYVGNYGKQAQIGMPYTSSSSGRTSVGRMNRYTWYTHFRLTGKMELVQPREFDTNTWSLDADDGRLGIVKNVSFQAANGKSTFANASAGPGSVSVLLNEYRKAELVMYNSNYADFASEPLPQGKVNITGVMKRFNNTWEIIVRSAKDIQPAN